MSKINVKICCNNMISAIKTGDIIINEGVFCLGNSKYKLKEPTKEFDLAIVKIEFCPWCGAPLETITSEIKTKIEEEDKNAPKN